MAIAKRHCRTCRCGQKLKRHVCTRCGTRKLEKFMKDAGTYGAFGKPQWRCRDGARCNENQNYR